MPAANYRVVNFVADSLSVGSKRHHAGHCVSVLSLVQRASPVGKLFGQHGQNPVGKINAGAAIVSVSVQNGSKLNVMADVGNVYAKHKIFPLPF